MGCTGSLFKKAPKEEAGVEGAADASGEVKSDNANEKKSAKAGKSAKKGKDKKEEGATEEVKVTANGKTGANSAKVRPMTPTPPAAPQNVPKPVQFDVVLDEQDSGAEATETENTATSDGSGSALRLPRKLPKLSSRAGRKDSTGESGTITNEEIQEKQRKADSKRQEILEEKKQKARKFVEKFGNNSKSASAASSQEDEDEDEELNGGGMNGLDSGLGLDKYGLDGDVKIDDEMSKGSEQTADGGKDPSPGMDQSTLPQAASYHLSYDQTEASTSNTNFQATGLEYSISGAPSLAPNFEFQEQQQSSANSGQTEVTNVASSSQSTINAQADISKSQCMICGDFASGRHYNVVSCEGCKGFFRRTVLYALKNPIYHHYNNSVPNIYKCNNGKYTCPISADKSRRRCCKSCRYERCVLNGMTYDAFFFVENNAKNLKPEEKDKQSQDYLLQQQLYSAFDHSYCILLKQIFSYLQDLSRSTGSFVVNDPAKTAAVVSFQSRFAVVVEHLRTFCRSTLQEFCSQIKVWRQIDIHVQGSLISETIDKLLLVALAMLFDVNQLPKPLCENSYFFNNAELQKFFVKLQNHVLKLSHIPPPVLVALSEDENLPMPPQSIMHELEELANKYDSRIVPELVPFTQGYYHAEQLKEYINQKIAATNLQQQAMAQESKLLEDEEEISSRNDIESIATDNAEKLSETDAEYNENSEVDAELNAEKERQKLIELKEKYRHMPILMMLLLTSSTGGKIAEKELQVIATIRESLIEMFMRDISWLNKEQSNEEFAETSSKAKKSSKRSAPSLRNTIHGVGTKRPLVKENSPSKVRLLGEVTEADSKYASISPEFAALCQVLTITSQLAVFFKSTFSWLG